jgi:excisionase family DNA binding protein
MGENQNRNQERENNYGEEARRERNDGLGFEGSLLFEKRIACEWLSTQEAAHFLSLSENALRILAHRGRVPSYKFGRRLRFRLKDCQALFRKKEGA